VTTEPWRADEGPSSAPPCLGRLFGDHTAGTGSPRPPAGGPPGNAPCPALAPPLLRKGAPRKPPRKATGGGPHASFGVWAGSGIIPKATGSSLGGRAKVVTQKNARAGGESELRPTQGRGGDVPSRHLKWTGRLSDGGLKPPFPGALPPPPAGPGRASYPSPGDGPEDILKHATRGSCLGRRVGRQGPRRPAGPPPACGRAKQKPPFDPPPPSHKPGSGAAPPRDREPSGQTRFGSDGAPPNRAGGPGRKPKGPGGTRTGPRRPAPARPPAWGTPTGHGWAPCFEPAC